MFYKEVQLVHKPYTLHTLTREIQRQSGITFSYDAVKIDPNKKVRLRKSLDRMTVKELLAVLRRKTGVGYKIVSSTHIIYTLGAKSGKKKLPHGKKSPAKRRHKTQEDEAYAGTSPGQASNSPVTGGDNASQHQIIIVGDSSVAAGYYLSGGGGGAGAYGGNNTTSKYNNLTVDVPEELNDDDLMMEKIYRTRSASYPTPLGQTEAVAFIKQSTLMAAGFTADEVYYLSPTLKAGFSFLYGTVSYNLGSFPHWRYGLGTSIKVKDKWTVHFEWSKGSNISQRYNITSYDTAFQPPPEDTLLPPPPPIITERNTPLLVKSQLNRFTLAAEWAMGRNIYLGGGLTLNVLQTTYYSNGNPVALSDILPIGYDADLKYRTINPPYLFSNSYSGNTSSNTKIWIGVQLRFVYKLGFFRQE